MSRALPALLRHTLRAQGPTNTTELSVIAQGKRLEQIRKCLRNMPDAYITAWEYSVQETPAGPRRGRPVAVWDVVIPPPDARLPAKARPRK